jgi:hypothetical protein
LAEARSPLPVATSNAYNFIMIHVVRSCKWSRALVAALVFVFFFSGALNAQDSTHRGRKYTPPPPTAKITVTVLKATNGKAVENAAVVFHPIKNGKDEGSLELKTNEEGKVSIDVIPIGDTVRLQVIASGYQTFGDDYDITTDSKDITVKMKPPDHQYSIYEKHDESKQQGGSSTSSDQPEQKPQSDSSKPPQSY